jgi:hypothetical protein
VFFDVGSKREEFGSVLGNFGGGSEIFDGCVGRNPWRDPSFAAFYAHLGIIFAIEMERDEFGRVSESLVSVYVGEAL